MRSRGEGTSRKSIARHVGDTSNITGVFHSYDAGCYARVSGGGKGSDRAGLTRLELSQYSYSQDRIE